MKKKIICIGLISSIIVSSMNLLTVSAEGMVIGTDPDGNAIIGGIYDELVGFDEDGKPIIKNTNPNEDKPVAAEGVLVGFDEDGEAIISARGDLNFDGKVDLTDLSELSLAIIGDKTLTESQIKVADIDKNGKADLPDLARLKQYLSKVITALW